MQNNTVLLIKRASKPFKGYWALPGGHKEKGESFEECVKREIMEETGLCVSNLEFFGGIRVKNKYGLQFSQFFLATLCSYDIQNQPEEVIKVKFFPINSLPTHIVPFQKEIIEDQINSM